VDLDGGGPGGAIIDVVEYKKLSLKKNRKNKKNTY